MLERSQASTPSPQPDGEIAPRPVKFRGAGFTPTAGRYAGWIALALVIGLWQLAGSAGWVNPLFRPAPSAFAVAIYKLATAMADGAGRNNGLTQPALPASCQSPITSASAIQP